MPICCRCQAEKSPEEFHLKSKATGRRQSTCRECMRAYREVHYRANRDAYIGRAKARNAEERALKRKIAAELRGRPCADCGRRFPAHVMQFDHREPEAKVGPIANMKNAATGMPKFLAELAKCDVLCANCHCERTHRRRQGEWREDAVVPSLALDYAI